MIQNSKQEGSVAPPPSKPAATISFRPSYLSGSKATQPKTSLTLSSPVDTKTTSHTVSNGGLSTSVSISTTPITLSHAYASSGVLSGSSTQFSNSIASGGGSSSLSLPDERATSLEDRIYAKSFLIDLRPPPSVLPPEDIIEAIKSTEIWLDNYNIIPPDNSVSFPPPSPSSSSPWTKIRQPKNKLEGRPRAQKDEQEMFRTSVQSVLNKLTVDKFERLSNKLIILFNEVDQLSMMKDAVNLLQKKAMSEANFSNMYAELCKKISTETKTFPQPNSDKAIGVRQLLLNRCQEVFESSLEPITPEEEPDEEIRIKHARDTLGNVVFLGALFNKALVPSAVVAGCLKILLEKMVSSLNLRTPRGQTIAEGCCEKFCLLLATTGKILASSKSKSKADELFKKVESLESALPMRFKFMIKDLVEMQQKDWTPRRKEEGPKTIEDIHNEAWAHTFGLDTTKLTSAPAIPKAPEQPKEVTPTTVTKVSVGIPVRVVVSRRIIQPSEETPKAHQNKEQPTTTATSKSSTTASTTTTTPDVNTDNSTRPEHYNKKLEALLSELFDSHDVEGVVSTLADFNIPSRANELVVNGINQSLEKREEHRNLLTRFLISCQTKGLISEEQFRMGVSSVLSSLPDLSLDVPFIHSFLGHFICEAVQNSCLSQQFVDQQISDIVKDAQHVDKLHAQIKKMMYK